MAMAFDRRDPAVPTERWKGSIKTVFEDGGFNGVIGRDYEDRTTLIEIPVENIIESERDKIGRATMFFADVEVYEGVVKTVRALEFINPEPLII